MSHQCIEKKIAGKTFCPLCLAEKSKSKLETHKVFEQKIKEESIQRNIAASGIPKKYLEMNFDSLDQDNPQALRVINYMKEYVNKFEELREARNGFIFTGNIGTGKTTIACAVAHGLLNKGYTAAYVSMPSLTHMVRHGYKSREALDPHEWIEHLSSMDFLVIDEIDLHGNTDSDYQFLYDLINSRYNRNGYPTIAISNRSLDDLTVDLHERIVSRINGKFNSINFSWESKRT